jgi:adenylosuccinate lyase
MQLSTLSALSPLDGRYASKTQALRPILSESGFMHHRVKVEIAWLIALSEAGFAELKPFSEQAKMLLNQLGTDFSEEDAARIKAIEATTNHDVKAVEYWLKEKVSHLPELIAAAEFIHFACTSEDINNTSHGMMLKAARDNVMLPALDEIIAKLTELAHDERRLAHDVAHPRPARQPDHLGQRNRQCGGAPSRRQTTHRQRCHSGQNERRCRQLQCAPVSLPIL